MAGRGPKLREYRSHISTLKEWQNALNTNAETLLIVEIFANTFGPCQAILPTVNSIMMNIQDAEEKISWYIVNVHKMYDFQLAALEEERKKNADSLSINNRHNRDSSQVVITANPVITSNPVVVREEIKEESEDMDTGDQILNNKPGSRGNSPLDNPAVLDSLNIPLLAAYCTYTSSRPKWLFIKDKRIVYELSSANPPKMIRLIESALDNVKLSDAELSAMDFRSKSENIPTRPSSVKSNVGSRLASPKAVDGLSPQSEVEPKVESSESLKEGESTECNVEAQSSESNVEAQSSEPNVEVQPSEPNVETQSSESNVEIQSSESNVETQSSESNSPPQSAESNVEAQLPDSDSPAETQSSEPMKVESSESNECVKEVGQVKEEAEPAEAVKEEPRPPESEVIQSVESVKEVAQSPESEVQEIGTSES